MRNEKAAGTLRARYTRYSPLTPHPSPRPGFSLAELMIAIVILGLGLLVAAAMFPIAWSKARDLAEHTDATACADLAELSVRVNCRVDSASPGLNFTSFAGDYVTETSTTDMYPTAVVLQRPCDTWVHFLTVENMLVGTSTDPYIPPIVAEQAWRLSDDARAGDDDEYIPESFKYPQLGPDDATKPDDGRGWYKKAQVLLHDRIYPAMPPWPGGAANAEELARWQTRLDSRRYAWAVFHRLSEIIEHPTLPLCTPSPCTPKSPEFVEFVAQRREAAGRPRVFTMYYVTLRRGATQRFARQDETELAAGHIKAMGPGAADLPPGITSPDVKLPSPWLVPLTTPLPDADPTDPNSGQLNYRVDDPANPNDDDVVPRGVPTEVIIQLATGVRPGGNSNDEDFREFFPAGATFIDHVNGQLYRVVKVRFDDQASDPQAILTLDREIFVEDLRDPGRDINPPYNELAAMPGSENASRRVWVFPPAVEARGAAGDPLVVEGRSPVVDIAVRSMTIHPQ